MLASSDNILNTCVVIECCWISYFDRYINNVTYLSYLGQLNMFGHYLPKIICNLNFVDC